MNDKIDAFFKIINKSSLDKIDYDYIYRELICYNNRNINDSVIDILRVFSDMVSADGRYIKIDNDCILISNDFNLNDTSRCVRLSIFNKLDYVIFNIESIISFCNKKKICFNGKLKNYDNVGFLEIDIKDIDDATRVIDFINNKLKNNIYDANPLFFSIEKIMVSFNGNYSYIEILAKYLEDFISKMNGLNKIIDYDNFKNYMLEKYYKIDNQIDMNKLLNLNFKDIEVSKFFNNLDECTNLILYLFNGNDFDKFRIYYYKISRRNCRNKYAVYDDMDDCSILFRELVSSMYFNYGEEYTKDNIIKYRDTGIVDYITRKDNLRRRVMSSKNFMIYILKTDLNEEIDKIIDDIKFEKKKKILENICREIFLRYIDYDNKNYSKIQVAKSLIRMSYGDYSTITRNNDARKMAIDNINAAEVKWLIKKSLGIDKVVKEEELYELYADYIENICIGC